MWNSCVGGPVNISRAVNTFYPILAGEPTLNAGAQAVKFRAVPISDAYGNDFVSVLVATGNLALLIKMVDAEINSNNLTNYGLVLVNYFSDQIGGTGFTYIRNTKVFEYVITLT
jgi:hypothetical protein